MDITSNHIKELLKSKHSEDIFVTECKIGSATMQRNCQIFDAWVMNKSWANAKVTGYEIKVSRSDFLNDTKYRGYLDYCNSLYFICPPKLILPEEIDKDVGLIYVSKNCTRLYTKKKAPFRDVEIPESIFRYILMCRTKIQESNFNNLNLRNADTKKEYWKKWLKNKQVDYYFGCQLGKTIRKTINNEIDNVKTENRRINSINEQLQSVKDFLNEIGVDMKRYGLRHVVERQLKELDGIYPSGFKRKLDSLIEDLQRISSTVEKRHED